MATDMLYSEDTNLLLAIVKFEFHLENIYAENMCS